MAIAKATVAENRNNAVQRILCGQMAVKQFTATDVTRRMSNPMSEKTLREKLKNPGAFRLAELWDIAAVLGIDKETLKSVI